MVTTDFQATQLFLLTLQNSEVKFLAADMPNANEPRLTPTTDAMIFLRISSKARHEFMHESVSMLTRKQTRSPRNHLLLLCAATLSATFSTDTQAGLHEGVEYDSLVSFYNSTNGANWSDNSGWLSGDACGWFGITCDQDTDPYDNTSHVTDVFLSADNLTGSIPSLLGLTHLQTFYVDTNQLTGPIPSLAGMNNLYSFWVDHNQLTGTIPPLSGLKLGLFFVGNNQLTGSIPPLAATLSGFGADTNQLTGEIPSLDGLIELRGFNVSSNQLTGPIPVLAGSPKLEFVGLSFNQLTGTIPPLGSLTHLQSFYVEHNHLTGPIPSLDGLNFLQHFFANSNQLTGSIPSLAGKNILQYFYAGANKLSGAVPSAPASLQGASLCPNLLDVTPQPTIDPMWNSLMHYPPSPWWASPYSTNQCDDLFTDGLGDPIVY